MTKRGEHFGLYSLLLSVIYVALGLVLIIWPATSARTICFALGAVLLVVGIFHIIAYAVQNYYSSVIRQSLTIGIVLSLLGVFIMLRTNNVLKTMPFVFGILLVADSASKIQRALDLRRAKMRLWYITFLGGLITAILGIILIINPFTAIIALNIYIGVSLIVNSISNLISAIFILRKHDGDIYNN